MEKNQNLTDKQSVDTFYEDFWKDRSAHFNEANKDEQARARLIVEMIRKYVLSHTDVPLNILDLGCGRGWLTHILTSFGNVIGIDPVPSSIKRARELFPDLSFQCCAIKHFLQNHPQKKFDLVVCSEVLEHIPYHKQQDFVEKIEEILEPNGHAIITTPRGELQKAWQRKYPKIAQPIEDWVTTRRLYSLCSKASLKVIQYRRIFIEYFRYNLRSWFLTSKSLRFLRKYKFLDSVFNKLKFQCGLYQIIVVQKG